MLATMPEGPYKTKAQAEAAESDKACSGVNTGFATSPSFLLVAALSITLLGMHYPLE